MSQTNFRISEMAADYLELMITAAHDAAIHCPRQQTTGPVVQHADISPPQSTTLGFRYVARKLQFICHPVEDRRLS